MVFGFGFGFSRMQKREIEPTFYFACGAKLPERKEELELFKEPDVGGNAEAGSSNNFQFRY